MKKGKGKRKEKGSERKLKEGGKRKKKNRGSKRKEWHWGAAAALQENIFYSGWWGAALRGLWTTAGTGIPNLLEN